MVIDENMRPENNKKSLKTAYYKNNSGSIHKCKVHSPIVFSFVLKLCDLYSFYFTRIFNVSPSAGFDCYSFDFDHADFFNII